MVKLTKSLKQELKATIKNNFKRYLSLLSIIFLGVMFYVGMKSNAPVLQQSMIDFIEETNFMDMEIASAYGFTDKELKQLKEEVPEIAEIEGGYEQDIFVELHDQHGKRLEKNFSIKSYSDKKKINRLYYLEGREATKAGECIADASLVEFLGYKLGDTITITGLDNLVTKELTIVGFVRSPEYIAHDYGASKLASGKISYFLYVPEDNFDFSETAYNVARIKLVDKYRAFTTEYNNYVEEIKEKINDLSDKISKERKDAFLAEKKADLDVVKDEFNAKKDEALIELDEAAAKIASAEAEIASAEANIMSDKEVDLYIAYNKAALDNAKEQLNSTKQMLDIFKNILENLSSNGDINADTDLESLRNKLSSWTAKLQSYEDTLNNLNRELENKKRSCENVTIPQAKNACNSAIEALEGRIDAVNLQIANAKSNINAINQVIAFVSTFNGTTGSLRSYLANLESDYNKAYKEYKKALSDYEKAKNNLKNQMSDARKLIEEKKIELAAAQSVYDEKYREVHMTIDKNQEEIDRAEILITKLGETSWYEFTRNDSNGYSQYYGDVERINGIAKILPTIFFLVAGLVTASSISRMAAEEREKMGVLKSLGYTSSHILYKYLYYTISAAVIGSILGVVVGSFVFPKIFAEVYSIIYYIIDIKYSLYFSYILVALVLVFLSTVCVAYFSVKSTLKETASDLMRPKVSKKEFKSKKSKRWRKMSFFKKVTIRNIVLNKGKSLMTVFGVAGCTALIVTGFGTRESISNIVFYQFGNIYDISAELFYNDELTEYEIEEVYDNVAKDKEVTKSSLSRMETINVKAGLKTFYIYLIVPHQLEEFKQLVDLRDYKTDGLLELTDEGVILSEKIAKLLSVKVGDKMTYTNTNGIEVEVKVIGITTNYVYHYMYMTPKLYEKLNSIDVKNNMILVKYADGVDIATKSKKFLETGNFANFLSLVDAKTAYDDILSRFDMILFVIIISAALLAFVVLYNLAKINISEKTREIATLKVLGFRAKEVNKFINREILFLTIIGIIIGLVGGLKLTDIVVSTCEVEDIMFYHGISYTSLVYATILTTIFSIIIKLFINRDIKKINLVESLKTLE